MSLQDLDLTPAVFSYGINAPQLTVTYKGGEQAVLGNVLTPTQVQDEPTVQFDGAEDHVSYTLVMTDPDAPSRAQPTFREWWHWIVVNIPGSDLKKGDISKGTTHWDYVGAGPPEDTGLHRYVFCLFKQKKKKEKFENPKGFTANGRGKNHVEPFAKKYGLGHPVAIACFQAEHDDHVPLLYKQLDAGKK